MTTQNRSAYRDKDDLTSFLREVTGEDHLRVETEFGGGFVRLNSSEAERRQAAQDIQSTEDIVLEMLRNSRDAHARVIFIATSKEEHIRSLVIIDDGDGIPEHMHSLIFEPRVTSKLDTAHLDKWGIHGRGMALYSISVNSLSSSVVSSAPGIGSSIKVEVDLTSLREKTDQSTFPYFEKQDDGSFSMRGPKNILRTAAEFSLEHRDTCSVRCGSPVEICASLYEHGISTASLYERAFCEDPMKVPLSTRLAYASDPGELTSLASSIGLVISERTARRIMNGEICSPPTLLARLEAEGFARKEIGKKSQVQADAHRKVRLTEEDVELISSSVLRAYDEISSRYYLNAAVEPSIRIIGDELRISIPLISDT